MAYAINPYSFVPFAGEVEKKPLDDYYPASESLLTGRLDVTMIAKTPLIVPDGANYQETALQTNTDTPDTHKTYTFYHVKDENGEMRYAIPGSSLRGVLRSAYEAVTNSCLPFFPDNKELSRRTPLNGAFKNRGLFGLVEDSDGKSYWTLYDVTDAIYTTNKTGVKNGVFRLSKTAPWLHTGQEVIFKKHPGYTSIEAIYPANQPPADCDPLLWEKGWIQFNIPVSSNKRMFMDVEEFYQRYGALDTGGDRPVPVLCKVGKDRNRREYIEDIKKFESGELPNGYTTGEIKNISEVRNAQRNRQRRVRAEIRVDIPYHIHILSPGKELKRWPVERGEKPEETEIFRLLQYSVETTTLEQTMQKGHGMVKVSTAGDLLKALNRAAGTKKRKPAGNLVPVYYYKGYNGVYYLSGSAVGRVGQARRWSDILGRDNANGDHSPCKSLSGLCPACALFGTAEAEEAAVDALTGRPSKVKGAKGRLRFTDAVVSTSEPVALETHTLQILANPKPTAYEFYQIQPEGSGGEPAIYWNFDYFGVKDRRPGHSREESSIGIGIL